VKRILVINIARIGDLIQSSPLIAGLKTASEENEVTLLYSRHFREVAEAISGVDRLIGVSLHELIAPLVQNDGGIRVVYRKLYRLVEELRSLEFDRVINITHTHYSAILTSLVNARDSAGMTMNREGYRVVNGDWANYYFNSCLNRAFNRFNLVDIHSRIGGVEPGGRLFLDINSEARSRADSLIRRYHRAGRKLVALVPGASTSEKAWHPDRFAETVRELGRLVPITPLILGSQDEVELGERIRAGSPDAVNLCGRTDLQLLAALAERCDLMIANDTGPMHVAAAVGTRVLDISLGSALSHETAPYGKDHVVVEPRIDCYPCHVRMRCPHRNCHALIEPAVVAGLADSLLENEEPQSLTENKNLHRINVYRTSFDEDGWWELTPLLRREPTITEIHNHALREMWKRALSGKPSWTEDYRKTARGIGRKLRDSRRVSEEWPSIQSASSPLGEIASLAAIGLAASRELASIPEDDNGIDRITRLGALLKEVDNNLIRNSYEHPEIKPLVAQFTYGKGNMTGWKLASLADQTAVLYDNLFDWSRALINWIETIYGGAVGSPAGKTACSEATA